MAGRDVALQLEMGGSNVAVVLADADLDAVLPHLANGAFSGSGQKCTAIGRIVVEEPFADEVAQRLAALADRWSAGPGLDPATRLGPLVTPTARDAVVAAASAARAREPRCSAVAPAWTVRSPTATSSVRRWCRGSTRGPRGDEVFGPFVAVIAVPDAERAVAVANDSPYGLNAGVFTRDVARALRLVQQLEVGMVHLNAVTGFPPYAPFGGVKDSGAGPLEQGPRSYEFFTRNQVVNLHPEPS